MNEDTKKKLADILERVKDPEDGMSVRQMNLVAGIKQNPKTKDFEVYMYKLQPAKACCMVFQIGAYSTIEQLLKKEIENEFPDSHVVFRNF